MVETQRQFFIVALYLLGFLGLLSAVMPVMAALGWLKTYFELRDAKLKLELQTIKAQMAQKESTKVSEFSPQSL